MKKYILLALIPVTTAFAQNPPPAKPQSEPILVLNGTAHLGNGQVIENSVLGFENGKITLIGDATSARADRGRYKKIIDAKGKHIYPGFINCNSSIGLSEIDLV